MRKKIFIFLVLATTKCISQIYFSPNSNMYVKNEVLYVTQNINLASNSNLYLRNNSQFIQGSASGSTNSGAGTLSVYQEGTSDNFDYNYWCSPVGNASASLGNENFGISMLSRPTTSTASTTAILLPAGDSNGIANPLSISTRWIHKLINAPGYAQWIHVGGASTIAPGEGFTMKGTSGTDITDPEGTGIVNNSGSAQRYDFRGKPNDGNITITLGLNNSTLTGNPYPSALHLNAFLLDGSNTAAGGIAYFWEQDKNVNSHLIANYRGGYGTYAPMTLASNGVYTAATFNSYKGDGSLNTIGLSSGLSIQRKYSPIGQGFLIYGTANGTAIFKNSHRVFYKEGQSLTKFEKHVREEKTAKANEETTGEVPHLKLNTIINNQFTRQLALAFLPEATDGIDFGIDAVNLDTALPNDVGFWLEDQNFVIQGVNFDPSKKIPLTVKVTTNSTFKFYIPEVIEFDNAQKIYLYDALDNSYHEVRNGMYEVTLAPGVYADRFKITFTDQTLGTPDVTKNQFLISQDNTNSVLRVSNPNSLAIKSFKLYDMMGRTVLSKKNPGNEINYTFSTSTLSQGIYIAEFLTTDNEKITQKVAISNSRN